MNDVAFRALEALLLASQAGQRDRMRESIRAAADAGAPDSLIERILEATRPPTLPLGMGQGIDYRIARAFSLVHLRVRQGRIAPLSARAIDILGADFDGTLGDAIAEVFGNAVADDLLHTLEQDLREAGHAALEDRGHRVFCLDDDGDERVLLLPGAERDDQLEALAESIATQLMNLHDLVRQAQDTHHADERSSLLTRVEQLTQEVMFRIQRRGEGSGSEPPPKGGVDATPILRSVVMEAGARAKARGIGVRAVVEDDLRVFARTRDVRAIASNLIENALDASARGGPIRVTAVRAEDMLDLRITDDGEGLDQLAQERAFETYFTTKAEGGGLGLPLVKHLITRLQGSLIVESEIGVGTTMRVLLPRYETE